MNSGSISPLACGSTTSLTERTPRKIGFMPVPGTGPHRLWYVCGRCDYAFALLEGYSDYVPIVSELQNPTFPTEVGWRWPPGTADGEEALREPDRRVALNHAIVSGGNAFVFCSQNVTLLGVQNPGSPNLLAHQNWSPPIRRRYPHCSSPPRQGSGDRAG